jgi:protein-glutamine gamma-glutamyltransferase
MAAPAAPLHAPASKPPLPAVERFFQFSLLGMLASGYFAVAGSGVLDWPTQALMLLALAARAAKIAGWLRLEPTNRTIAVLTIAYMGFYPLDFEFVSRSFLTATIHLIFFLAVIKMLTSTTSRDYGYLKMIATMELLAAALLSDSLTFFVFLALFLLFTIASLASGEVRHSAGLRGTPVRAGVRLFGRRLGGLSFVLFCGILTMTAGMFFVLPRTARAALSRFIPQRYHLPGFTNEITLGEIGEIKQSSRPVMHVRSYGGVDLTQVRWRGSELSQFDGKHWFNPPGGGGVLRVQRGFLALPLHPHSRPGREIAYRVQLEEVAADTLFFAGTPETITIDLPVLRVSRGGAYHIPRLPNGITYGVYSYLDDTRAPALTPPEPLSSAERAEDLELPDLDPRIPRLARYMAGPAATDEEKALALQSHLRHDYGYTLQLLASPVADPLANFLFVRKKGHCEYFASAMAVMLRTLGIPSRVVTGFLGGEFNPITGWQVVRASDAHSWVEAWIPGNGWTRFDPTPADPRASAGGLFNRISLLADAADQFWQDWVLSYDLERQVVLASRMQESSRRMHMSWIADASAHVAAAVSRNAVRFLLGLVAAAMLALFFHPAFARWRRARLGMRRAQRGEGQASDATMLYQRMLEALSRRGYHKPSWLTPSEFARVLPSSEISGLVNDLTAAYNEFRFGGRRDAAPRMLRLLEELESAGR